eukprot:380636-Pelagomonas_calceolata.AAC.1
MLMAVLNWNVRRLVEDKKNHNQSERPKVFNTAQNAYYPKKNHVLGGCVMTADTWGRGVLNSSPEELCKAVVPLGPCILCDWERHLYNDYYNTCSVTEGKGVYK